MSRKTSSAPAPVAAGAGPPLDRHWLDAERVRVYSSMIVAIFGTIFVIWLAMSLPDLVDPRGKPFGYDFMAFWSAAKLAVTGRAASAFDESIISAVQHAAVPSLPEIVFPWHYPPTFLLLIAPLGLLPYALALAVFVLAGAALWALLVRRVLPDRRSWIVAAAAPAGLINLLDGQNAFLTAALAGFALLWLDRRPLLAGVLIGLLAMKPHLGLLFPLVLLIEHRWRTITAAAAAVLALAVSSLAAFGWASWAAFLDHLPVTQAMAEHGAVPWGTMPSAYVFALSLGAPVGAAWVLQGASAALAVAAVWRAWRCPAAPFEAKAAAFAAGSLLLPPYLFYYDLVWAVLAIGWLALLGLRTGFRRGEREVMLFAYLAPALMPPLQLLSGVQVGFPALVLLLVVATLRAAPPTAPERELLRRTLSLVREAPWITRARLLRWGTALMLASIVLIAYDTLAHLTAGLTNSTGEHPGRDFVNFWAGARLAADGQASLAYDPAAFNAFEKALIGPLSEFKVYSYPPTNMILTLPLAAVPFLPGLALWTGFGILLAAAPLSRLIGWRAALVAAVGVPVSMLDIITGQNGHFTAALFGGGLVLLERRPILAGVLFGLLCYKPQLGLLLPIALAAGGWWRSFIAAAATVCAVLAASVVVLGSDSWAGFLVQMDLQQRLMEVRATMWNRTQSVFLAGRMAGLGVTAAYIAQACSSVAAIALTILVWRGPTSFRIKAATLVLGTFLITPYVWDYDMVVIVFAAAWLGLEGSERGFLPWERFAVLLLLAQPLVTLNLTNFSGVQIAPIGLWFAMIVLVRRAVSGASVAPPPRLAFPDA
jgi:hypothetical protein